MVTKTLSRQEEESWQSEQDEAFRWCIDWHIDVGIKVLAEVTQDKYLRLHESQRPAYPLTHKCLSPSRCPGYHLQVDRGSPILKGIQQPELAGSHLQTATGHGDTWS